MVRLAFGELDFLDVRLADHSELLFGNGLPIRFRQQFALHLVVNVRAKRFHDQVHRRFSGPETRKPGLLLHFMRHLVERGLHRWHVHFHPQ